MKFLYYLQIFLYLVFSFIPGCDFDDPYVPESAGSSSLSGRIATDPEVELSGAEVLLRGERAYASVTDVDGVFQFQNIPPDTYALQIQKSP